MHKGIKSSEIVFYCETTACTWTAQKIQKTFIQWQSQSSIFLCLSTINLINLHIISTKQTTVMTPLLITNLEIFYDVGNKAGTKTKPR